MSDRPSAPVDASDLLSLARKNRADATRALESVPLERQVALVCEAPVEKRARLLDLLPMPEEVFPRLPEAELCFTVKAVGLEDAAWVLDEATPEQVVACLDLDAWSGLVPDTQALDAWIECLAETRTENFLRALRALDPELVLVFLERRIHVVLQPDDDEGWEPPPGSQTLDGQFHFVAVREDDDLAPVVSMLRALFERDYWTYFRMLQGVIWEPVTENEVWAERWRAGRLEDLGFPRWEEAMRIYGHLPPERRAEIPEGVDALDVGEWHLPVWLPSLPVVPDAGAALLRAIAELSAEERTSCFYALVAMANKIAVADGMPLSDAESTPRALEKAVRFAGDGLAFVAEENALDVSEVLRRVPLERLFRVGANLDPEAARPGRVPDPEASA